MPDAPGSEGIFILIPKQEHKIEVLASRAYAKALPGSVGWRSGMRSSRSSRSGDFNAGLKAASRPSPARSRPRRPRAGRPAAPGRRSPRPYRVGRRPAAGGQRFGLGSLLGIGLVILAVLVVIRLLGSLFGGGRQYQQGPGGPGMMGRPGYGPAPAMAAAATAARGGGFMSSLFGGHRRRHGGQLALRPVLRPSSRRQLRRQPAYTPGNESIPTSDPGDDWVGGGSEAGDWGGGGGGGGGDWGGGGGGGDWGGGGDDGGSW